MNHELDDILKQIHRIADREEKIYSDITKIAGIQNDINMLRQKQEAHEVILDTLKINFANHSGGQTMIYKILGILSSSIIAFFGYIAYSITQTRADISRLNAIIEIMDKNTIRR